ncbi:RecF/RecN/SMC [Blastocladiella britannica]|nr:RecF/RecN/SMC [Blastocladiella britannica]
MHIKEIVLDGFKSYATRTVISGWDPKFNAVTGLNGSGKSNILDAICFVLGITTLSHVRANNLHDLVYKRGQAGIQKATVSIVFDNRDKPQSPVGYAHLDEIVVTRQVVVGGKNKYLINGHTSQQNVVANLFQSVQLNVNNPHFLIMQGRITKVLNMKPLEILAMVEEAAGTRMFEERKEKAEKTIAKKVKRLDEISDLLISDVLPKLDRLRAERNAFLEYQQLVAESDRAERRVVVLEHAREQNRAQSAAAHATTLLESVAAATAQLTKLASTQAELAARDRALTAAGTGSPVVQDLLARETAARKRAAQLSSRVDVLRRSVADESNAVRRAATTHASAGAALSELADRQADAARNTDRATVLVEDCARELERLQDRIAALTEAAVGDGNTAATAAAAERALQDERALLASIDADRSALEARIVAVDRESAALEPELERARRGAQARQEEMSQLDASFERVNAKLAAMRADLAGQGLTTDPAAHAQGLKAKRREMAAEISSLTRESEALYAKVAHAVSFDYSDPTANFDRSKVFGTVASLLRLDSEHANKASALEMAAGSRLYDIVVADEHVGSQLLQHGRLKKRVTLIPLTTIRSDVITRDKVQRAKKITDGKAVLALDLVQYDKGVKAAMEYVFGSTFICQDPKAANAVTYDRAISAQSVTWAGDVYDPSGMLSGGDNGQSSSGPLLVHVMRYHDLQARIATLGPALQALDAEIASAESATQALAALVEFTAALQARHEAAHAAPVHGALATPEAIAARIADAAREHTDLVARQADLEQRAARTRQTLADLEADAVAADGASSKAQEAALRQRLAAAKKAHSAATKKAASAKMEAEQVAAEADARTSELEAAQLAVQAAETAVATAQAELRAASDDDAAAEAEVAGIAAQLAHHRRDAAASDAERAAVTKRIKQLEADIAAAETARNDAQSEAKRAQRDVESAKAALRKLTEKFPWLASSSSQSSESQSESQLPDLSESLTHAQSRLTAVRKRLEQLKRAVNVHVMEMIGVAERRERELQEKLATVQADKVKIEDTISRLDDIKESELRKTWEQVNADFGTIFGELLPGNNTAELRPADRDRLLSGLEIRVRLGKIWKESLAELSGGQRSLIALALVLALLQFKPAPMYILDEVDAALDLSHTQNIGQLIKTRFTGSQFIIVSLKEGMFNNAHTIFKTKFRDGTSTVDVIKGSLSSSSSHAPSAEAATASRGASRR